MDPEDIVFEFLEESCGDAEEALAALARHHVALLSYVDRPDVFQVSEWMDTAATHEVDQIEVI